MASREIERGGLDRMFDALSHTYRRRILQRLSEATPRDVDELAPADVVTEEDDPLFLETELHHCHLPKLDEAGYVAWDPDTRTISRGPRYGEIAPLVAFLHDHRDALPAGRP